MVGSSVGWLGCGWASGRQASLGIPGGSRADPTRTKNTRGQRKQTAVVGWLGGWVDGWVLGWLAGWLLVVGCWIQPGNGLIVTMFGNI